MEVDGFDWDRGNVVKSVEKHGVSTREVEEVFLNDLLFVYSDAGHSGAEERSIAFGKTNEGRLLSVAFTIREKGDKRFLRPISARPMHKKERLLYEEAISENEKP